MIRSSYSLDEAISHSGYQDRWRDIPQEVIDHLDNALTRVNLDQEGDYHPDNLIINHLDVATVDDVIEKYELEPLPTNTDALTWIRDQLGTRYTILAIWDDILLICDHVDAEHPYLPHLFRTTTLDRRHASLRK